MYDGHNIIIHNEYPAIYLPNHHRAFCDGCVRIHIIEAEYLLGRRLKPKEHVHHKDENKLNYCRDNLMVFATNSDHISYHSGKSAVLREDGSYECPDKSVAGKKPCSTCGRMIWTTADICRSCYNKNILPELQAHIPSKKELEEKLYSMSFKAIGRDYGVSDNAVRKWCRKYGLPFRKKDLT